MRINNITISTGLLLASASAVRIQTKFFKKIGNWVKNTAEDVGEFFEEDFVDFFEETIPDVAMSGVDAFTETGFYNGVEDAFDWASKEDNWAALGKTLFSSTLTGFSGDWEYGWEIFTDPSYYYGNTYDEIEALQEQ